MPRKKFDGLTIEEIKEEVQEEEIETPVIPESKEKIAFRNLIKVYKAQNPKKYALKKEALENKLNSME